MLARHVSAALIGDVGGDHALDAGRGHVAAHAVRVEAEALRALVLHQVGGHGGGGIHEIGRRGLGQVHDLVTIGEERLLDGLLQGHALDIGSDYDSHWPSF